MPAKLTILLCALLMPGLAATQANAQGFIVSKSETDVVEYGRNQAMGAIRLDYSHTGGNIDDGRTIKVSYGRLYLTGGAELLCAGTFNRTDTEETANTSCDSGVEAAIANHKDSGVGTVTITLGTARPDANQFAYVVLRGVRADVSLCLLETGSWPPSIPRRPPPVSFPSVRRGPKTWAAGCPSSRTA